MLLERRPSFTNAEAEALALEHYALSVTASALPSERDQNFKLVGEAAYVLKISHPDEDKALLEAQQEALSRLTQHHPGVFPRVLPSVTEAFFPAIIDRSGRTYRLWLIPFLPGRPVAKLEHLSSGLLHDIGRRLGEMDAVLNEIDHPALRRTFQWAAQSAPEVIREGLSDLPEVRRKLLQRVLEAFERAVTPRLNGLRRSVIHNDVNDYNLLVSGDSVTAILDFGDMLRSYTLCDPAHACAYLMLYKPDPLKIVQGVLRGYETVYPLNYDERHVLYDFICLRLALSVTMSALQQRREPGNLYLSVSERPVWALLERLEGLEPDAARRALSEPSFEGAR